MRVRVEGGGEQDGPVCVTLTRCRGTRNNRCYVHELSNSVNWAYHLCHFIYTLIGVVYFNPCRTWQ